MVTICTGNDSLKSVPEWAEARIALSPDSGPPVWQARYSLHDLARRGLVEASAFEVFRRDTLLADFSWRLLWAADGTGQAVTPPAAELGRGEGLLVFIHGWDGSGEVWEDLPALAVARNPRLVALVPDVNGFGGTPFDTQFPPVERCNPPALIAAVEQWLEMIELAPGFAGDRACPTVFVGHSMGGAALFFLDEARWPPGLVGRVAAAPALLLKDRQRKRWYRMLGAGITLSRRTRLVDCITERLIAPGLIRLLAGRGSERVHAEHRRIYRTTPEGVLGRTFAAMGLLEADLRRREWPDFAIYLADRDRLVGLEPTQALLEDSGFLPSQVQVVAGDHYFFSVGRRADLHARNRERLLGDILAMHRALADQNQ